MRHFIHKDLIGYTMHQAETPTKAWAEAVTEVVPLESYFASDKTELQENLADLGFTTITVQDDLPNLFEVKLNEERLGDTEDDARPVAVSPMAKNWQS